MINFFSRIRNGFTNIALGILCVTILQTPALSQTKIAVAVNNGVITTNQIVQRGRFLRLSGFKGDIREEAQRQLINEELQFQEAKRINFSIPDSAVASAFANVAKSNGATPSQFSAAMRANGVNPSTFKRLIRARILWQQIVVARARQEGRSQDDDRDITSILFNRANGGKNRTVKEYTIDQIIFVVRKDSPASAYNQRRRELEVFRNQNKTCEEASEAALRLAKNGVIMRKLGRFTTDNLPDNIRSQVLNANGQTFTPPEQGDTGVGMLAICNIRDIVDNSASGQEFGENIGSFDSADLEKKSAKWLNDLRTNANVVIR